MTKPHETRAIVRSRVPLLLLAMVFALLLALRDTAPVHAQVPDDFPGFRVEGRRLTDRFGNQVILVGVNKMVIWTDRDGLPSFPEIAKTGANAVRIAWLTEGTAEELDIAISNAISHKLIPIVDCHDSTGKWERLPACVDYWVRPDIVPVLRKHEAYLLINIANEAGEGVVPSLVYRSAYELAIHRMRAAGLHVPLIIDAQGYGQNIDDLQDNGPHLIKADPDHNLMFSIHMWWPTAWRGPNVAQIVIDEIAESVAMDLPLLIGEFANLGPGCACCIPYETIIEQAHLNEVGYLPWSWGPGNSDCAEMDMTEDGAFATLHDWGLEVAITSPHSIQAIAVRPDWIVDATPVAPPTPAPTPTPLPAPEGLISAGRPVEVSSIENMDLDGPNAVDGRMSTRWASESADPQTLTVDLGEIRPIERIVLEWETAYGREYKLQVSEDGEAWTDVVHVTGGDGDRDDHEVSTEGRYVRMQGLERGTQWGYSLWEFWVFERADVPLPQLAPDGDVTTVQDKRPDLVVTDLQWSPDSILVGDTVVFEAVIENRGTTQSPFEPVGCNFQIGGQTVAAGEFHKPLAPGGSAVCTGSAWQTTEPGEFIVLAWVDAVSGTSNNVEPGDYGRVDEVNENNNMLTDYGLVRLTEPAATQTPPVPEEPTLPAESLSEATAAPLETPEPGAGSPKSSVWIIALIGGVLIVLVLVGATRARRH